MSLLTAMDWLSLIICVSFGLAGYNRGAINSLIRFGGFIASFIMGIIFSPILADYLIDSGMMAGISKNLDLESLTQILLQLPEQGQEVTEFLSNSGLISTTQEALNTAVIYGLAHFISFGLIMVVCSIAVIALQFFFKGVTSLPLIGGIDRILGLIIGLCSGLVILFLMIWIFSMIDLYGSESINLLNYQSSFFYQKIVTAFLTL
ncbi:CvpA family protein [Eubacteriaceae bacterium ES3]|nr:CvpA family protein [Eubacteriaceae bacterium ES3]